MNYKKSLWPFIENSHLIIALSAVALYLETKLYLDEDLLDFWVLPIGFGTLVFYGLHRLLQSKKYQHLNSARVESLHRFRKTILGSTLLGCIGILLVFIFHPRSAEQINLIISSKLLYPFLGLGLFYLIPWNKKLFRLRDLPYLKIFIISIGWTLVTAYLPLLLFEKHMDMQGWIYILERALFIFTITLPFELRDLDDDRSLDIKTLGTKLGEKNTKRLIRALSIFGILLAWVLKYYALSNDYFLGLIAVYIFLLLSTYFIGKVKYPHQYTMIWDGIMIFRFIIIFLLVSAL